MRHIVLIAHNVRSTHNVGSLLRTAEGLGISKVYLTGYTPYPLLTKDTRLPHIAQRLDSQIHKTALGAEDFIDWEQRESVFEVIDSLRYDGYEVCAVEQAAEAMKLNEYLPPQKIALVVGREVEGIEPEVLSVADTVLEIPMHGKKESFNVVQAAAMVLYHCRFA